MSQESQPASRRRLLIIAVGLIVVLGATAIVAAILLTRTSKPKSPSTPGAAAQQWATALISHDSSGARKLECSQGSEQSSLFGLTVAVATGVTVRSSTQTGDSWTVVLDVHAPGDAGTQFPVPIVRQGDRFVVC